MREDDVAHQFLRALGEAMRKTKDEIVDSVTNDPVKAKEMKKVNPITVVILHKGETNDNP